MYAVMECSGASVECSMTGKAPAAAPASRPVIAAHDPAKARSSAVPRKPVKSAQAPPSTTATAGQANGRDAIDPYRSGRTIQVSHVRIGRSARTAIQSRRARYSLRACTGPVVLSRRYVAPCAASISVENTATDSVYQSRIPTRPRTPKWVNRDMLNVAARVERHAAEDVTERGAKQHRQQHARDREDEVPPGLPQPVGEVAADLDGDAAQDERPQHQPQRQVEPGERDGHDAGEGEQERAPEGQQPDFVPAPERTDGGDDFTALGEGPAGDQMQGAGADVPAVEHDEHGQQQAEQSEPQFNHARPPSSPAPAREGFRGPRDTDRAVRGRSRVPSARSA